MHIEFLVEHKAKRTHSWSWFPFLYRTNKTIKTTTHSDKDSTELQCRTSFIQIHCCRASCFSKCPIQYFILTSALRHRRAKEMFLKLIATNLLAVGTNRTVFWCLSRISTCLSSLTLCTQCISLKWVVTWHTRHWRLSHIGTAVASRTWSTSWDLWCTTR